MQIEHVHSMTDRDRGGTCHRLVFQLIGMWWHLAPDGIGWIGTILVNRDALGTTRQHSGVDPDRPSSRTFPIPTWARKLLAETTSSGQSIKRPFLTFFMHGPACFPRKAA